MFDYERKIYIFTLGYMERAVADISEEEMSAQPMPGMNTPRWVLAHLAISTDYSLILLGRNPVLPREWHQHFGPGSSPNQDGAPTPSKLELVDALKSGHERVLAAIEKADAAFLATGHDVQFESLQQAFPARGELLANMMTAHEGLHLGQLSAWRRASGRKPMF